jgi:hypothetical protein
MAESLSPLDAVIMRQVLRQVENPPVAIAIEYKKATAQTHFCEYRRAHQAIHEHTMNELFTQERLSLY